MPAGEEFGMLRAFTRYDAVSEFDFADVGQLDLATFTRK
jgi:hypothetical protein